MRRDYKDELELYEEQSDLSCFLTACVRVGSIVVIAVTVWALIVIFLSFGGY